ncbi:MAG: glycosyltransferase [Xenococcaceae cyanobacterium MO_167.B27]|nr:glycosyltransferase [Xenococcaceae cyanobacterium MO_167.B27]
MKVAFLVGRFPVLSESFILNQIAGLIDRGHEVDIYALDGAADHGAKVHPIVKKYHLLERTYYSPSAPKSQEDFTPEDNEFIAELFKRHPEVCEDLADVSKQGTRAIKFKLVYKAVPFLEGKTYDVIHCQFGSIGLMGLLFRNLGLLKGKLITIFRGSDISKYLQKWGDNVYDQLFQEGDFFLTNCEFFRKRAIKLGCEADKILILGSGIDCSKFAFTPRYFPADGRVRIATTGRLVEKKGIEYGIRAIASLAKTYPNIEYNIMGDGELREHFEQLIAELNVGHIVNLVGWKQQEELIEILDHSHILIAPSVTAADGNQDAPVNTLKEAMAMGLPVIGTLHGGIPELIEDGISGFLVPERDSDAIADKLGHLIEHPEIWADMGKAGRDRVEAKYDMNKLNDQLVEIYQTQLASESHTRSLVA